MVSQDIKQKAAELGYSSCGIIPADSFNEYTRFLDERVDSFPESKAFYERFYSNAKLPEPAKSIIVCMRRYNKYKIPQGFDRWVGKIYLFDGRIPYSNETRDRSEFEMYLNIGGINIVKCQVPDRWAAVKANLGRFGRNNFVYDPNHGSYCYIYAWAVDKTLDYDEGPESYLMPQCGDHCEKCIDACPTKALAGSLSMNLPACVSFISNYSETGEISDETTRSQMGQWLYGCDACQDACPMNQDKFAENEPFPLLDRYEQLLKPESIMAMDNDEYVGALNPRFWYTGPEGLWLWKCNALRAMINSDDAAYHDLIKQSCCHEDGRIREIAQWGCKKLGLTECI